MNEPRWDDERLAGAFRAAFERPAPADLVAATVERVRSTQRPRRRPTLRFLAVAAALAIFAASVALAVGTQPSQPPEPPRTSDDTTERAFGLPIVSVGQAIRHRETSLDDTELAVRAYYSGSLAIRCLFVPTTSPIERQCPDGFSWLMQNPERRAAVDAPPVGLALEPLIRNAAWELGARPPDGSPTPVVVLGHFDDYRSAACADPEGCRREFVVDRLVSVNGTAIDPEPWFDVGRHELVTDAPVVALRAASSGDNVRVLTVGAIAGNGVGAIEPAAATEPALTNAPAVWVVRRLETIDARRVVRTVLIPDGSDTAFVVDSGRLTAIAPSQQPRVPGPLSQALGLPVVGVEDALRIRDAGRDDREIAVEGWFTPAGPIECPAPLAPPTSPVQPECPDQFVWLMRDAERLITVRDNGIDGRPPTGPAFNVDVDDVDPSWVPQLPADGDSVPAHVVFVGHFDDRRSSFCPPADENACRDRFIVDHVAWVDGVPQPTSVVNRLGRAPRSDLEAVVARIGAVSPGPIVLHALVADGRSVLQAEPMPDSPRSDPSIQVFDAWLVRILERGKAVTYTVRDGTLEAWRIDASGDRIALPPPGPPPTPRPEPTAVEFPAEVHGLPVIPVADALARVATPNFDDSAVAVAGWYVASSGPVSCPMLPANLPPLERSCLDSFTWLMQEPERPYTRKGDAVEWRRPTSPAVNVLVRQGVGFDVPSSAQAAEPEPVAVVIVGHFGDVRAENFEQRKAFVADALVWVDGAATGNAVAGDSTLAAERPDAVEARIATTLGQAVATWTAVLPGDALAKIEPDLARRAPELTGANAIWIVHRLTVQDGRPFVGVAYTADGGTRVWGSNRFDPALQPTLRVDLDPRPDRDVPLDIVDGSDAIRSATPVAGDRPGLPGTIVHPPLDGVGSVALANVPGHPEQLRIDWAGTPCDTGWGLWLLGDARSIYLWAKERPACDVEPYRRAVILTFDRAVRAEDVVILDGADLSGG